MILFAEMNPERLGTWLLLIGDVRGKEQFGTRTKSKKLMRNWWFSVLKSSGEIYAVVYSWCDAASSSIRIAFVKPENIPDNCITEIPLKRIK